MRRFPPVLAAAVLMATLTPALAQASSPTAVASLTKVKHLQHGTGVKTGFEMSPALHGLTAALPSLTGKDRREAEAILARPTDSQADPENTHKWTGPEAPTSPVCTAHFCIHWTLVGPDASSSTYATQLAGILENEVYPCENGTTVGACAAGPGLGWREPAPDAGLGGSDAVDVYIEDLYTNEQIFGYVAADPGQDRDPSVPHYAYMVLDKDYTRYGDGSAAAGRGAEQVTAAHEYNHVLQNAYDYLEDAWVFEATAVYMEDKVYPSDNDYLNYVDAWVVNTKQPLTAFPKTNVKAYGSAVWNHWLDHRFGAAVVRSAWEQSVASGDFGPDAFGAAIAGAGGGDFATEFDRFAAAVAEWQNPTAGFPDRYPDVPRDGLLPVETMTTPFALPHTTFAFFDVPVPADSPPTIRLTGTLPTGTRGAVALVAREGADPAAGEVTTSLTPMASGGTAAVELKDPARYGRITAVVVNADPSTGGFDSTADDYIFTKDASNVTAAMVAPGPPLPTTGAAGPITDHGAVIGGAVDPHMLDTRWQVEYGRGVRYVMLTKPRELPASTVGPASLVVPIHNLKAHAIYHYRLLATNARGVTAGRDMFFRTLRDVSPPAVKLLVKKQRLASVRGGGLKYQMSCTERCFGTAELTLSTRAARKLGLPRLIAKSRVRISASTRVRRLRLGLPRRVADRLEAVRIVTPTLRVLVHDASRNSRKATRRAAIRP